MSLGADADLVSLLRVDLARQHHDRADVTGAALLSSDCESAMVGCTPTLVGVASDLCLFDF